MSPSPFLQRIRWALALATVAMLALAAAGYVAVQRLADFSREAVATEHELLALERAGRSLAEAQTAVRNYVLSGEGMALAEWQLRAGDVQAALQALRELGFADMASLEPLVRDRLALQQRAVAAREAGSAEAAQAVLTSTEAARISARLYSVLEAARAQQRASWARRQAVPTAHRTGALIAGAILLLLAMLGWVAYLSRQYERERRQYERERQEAEEAGRRAQARLDSSEALARTLAECTADGVLTTTAALTVADMNEAAAKMLGYSRSDVIGRPLSDFIAPDASGAEFCEFVGALLDGPEGFKLAGLEAMGRHQDGRLVPLRLSLSELAVGGERCAIAFLHDVSELQRAVDALRASEAHLREIADALPILIGEVDLDGRFSFHNRALEAFLGIDAGQIQGRHLLEVLGEERHATFEPYLLQALSGQPLHYERVEKRADGAERHMQIHLLPRHGAQGEVTGCYAYGTDVTELKRLDQLKTEFVSIVSHELRTPLTSIRGALGLVTGGVAGALPKGELDLLQVARSNCERLVRLINDILDIDKIESGKMALELRQADVAAIVRQTIAANEPFAQQHGVALQATGLGGLCFGQVDADRLVQVLTNLLSNAVKFSPAGSAVRVRLQQAAGAIRLEVEDSGPGIPPEFQARIFQKFAQAAGAQGQPKGGTGLGLSISRMLVERMGGALRFISPPGQGATFIVELPAGEGAAPCLAPDAGPAAAAALRAA